MSTYDNFLNFQETYDAMQQNEDKSDDKHLAKIKAEKFELSKSLAVAKRANDKEKMKKLKDIAFNKFHIKLKPYDPHGEFKKKG